MSGNTAETKFLLPVNYTVNSQPLFAQATGSAQYFNFSQKASGSLTSVEVDLLVNGGVASGIFNANATFIQDPTFSDFFVENTAVGESRAFEVNIETETKIVANFDITAGETFSFDFTADLDLTAKEIENPDTEYSKANLKTTFLMVDISNGLENAKLIDFFGFKGNLISSQQTGDLKAASSNNITFTSLGQTDIDGNNGIDYVNGFVTGNYEHTFNTNSKIALIETNTSVVELLGDTLINNLGNDVYYGTIWDDYLQGSHYKDKIYASLGDDTVKGYDGDDIIEGGAGNDWLYGGNGRDTIHGGRGDDYIDGGYGLDHIDGGDGYDTISYKDRSHKFYLDLRTGVLQFSNTGSREKIHNIEKVIASRGSDRIYGNQESNHLEGNDGNDYIQGVGGNNVLIGGDDFDTLIGGSGQDKINGTDSYNGGFYERDYLKGGGGADEFVLGNAHRAYYTANNNYDYAIIEDFKVGEDKLILHGSASDYCVKVYCDNAYIYYKEYSSYDTVAILDNIYSNFDLGSNTSFV